MRKGNNGGPSMLSALGMQFASKYMNVAVQLVVTMALARILTPMDFGIVAIVTVFTSFFSILADVGITTAIIQYKDLQKSDYDALFFASMLLGIVFAILFCILSVPISIIYDDSLLVSLCSLASFSVLFSTMNMVPNGILLRERRFASVSVRLVVASIVSGLLAIGLALEGAGCYSLIWQVVISSGIVLVWNCFATRLKLNNPRFWLPLRKIWRFSIYQAGFSTINYFARNLDNLFVGATIGAAQLGQYDKAYKLMGYPLNYLTGVFSDVLQPYLSAYQDDKRKLFESWLGICRILALVGMFVSTVFVCFPKEIVLVMYGDQWLPAVPVVATLGVSVGIQMVNSTSGAIFQSAGRTDELFKSGMICTGVSLVLILLGVATGNIALLGLFVSVAYVIHLLVTSKFLVFKVLGMRPVTFLKSLLPSTLAAIVSVVATYFVGYLTAGAGSVFNVSCRALVCVVVYLFLEYVTKEWRAISIFREMKTWAGLSE